MYKVMQYYKHDNRVDQHMIAFSESFKSAYKSLLQAYKTFPDCFVIVQGLDKEAIDYLVLYKLKDKDLITIVSS